MTETPMVTSLLLTLCTSNKSVSPLLIGVAGLCARRRATVIIIYSRVYLVGRVTALVTKHTPSLCVGHRLPISSAELQILCRRTTTLATITGMLKENI